MPFLIHMHKWENFFQINGDSAKRKKQSFYPNGQLRSGLLTNRLFRSRSLFMNFILVLSHINQTLVSKALNSNVFKSISDLFNLFRQFPYRPLLVGPPYIVCSQYVVYRFESTRFPFISVCPVPWCYHQALWRRSEQFSAHFQRFLTVL